MLLVDSAPFADMKKRLDPLAATGRTFRPSARELLALSAWHHDDVKAAKHYLEHAGRRPRHAAGHPRARRRSCRR